MKNPLFIAISTAAFAMTTGACATAPAPNPGIPAASAVTQKAAATEKIPETKPDPEKKDASEIKPQRSHAQDPAPECRFEKVRSAAILNDHTVIPSSVQFTSFNNSRVVIADTDEGDVVGLIISDSGTETVQTLYQNAQISGLEPFRGGFRTVVIRRNAETSAFALKVDAFDAGGTVIADETWNAETRNFSPDPGSRSLFLGRREILTTGMRPRGDHAPYHGMFKMESRALTFFEQTASRVPVLLDMKKSGDVQEIRVREIIRGENGKRQPRQTAYQILDDNTMRSIAEADFLIPAADGYLAMTKAGCAVRGDISECPDAALDLIDVADVSAICAQNESEKCLLMREKNAQWLARVPLSGGKPVIASMPGELQIYPVKNSSGDAWLGMTRDKIRTDTAADTAWYKFEADTCHWR